MLVSFNIILGLADAFILIFINVMSIPLNITFDLTNVFGLISSIHQLKITFGPAQISSIPPTNLSKQLFNSYINLYI